MKGLRKTDGQLIDDGHLTPAARPGVNPKRIVSIDGRLRLLGIRYRVIQNSELARAMGFDDDENQYEFVSKKAEFTK